MNKQDFFLNNKLKMVNTCTAIIPCTSVKSSMGFISEEYHKFSHLTPEFLGFLDRIVDDAWKKRSDAPQPREVSSTFDGKSSMPKRLYPGEEIAEALQGEAVFTIATDKKPIVATNGCYPCIAVGGYEPINKFAFIVHFASVDEVANSGREIINRIRQFTGKETSQMNIHLRGGIIGQSERLLLVIKGWLNTQSHFNMRIASEETLFKKGENGKSLLIDSRNGDVDIYDSKTNPLRRNPLLNARCIFAKSIAFHDQGKRPLS